MNVHVVCKLMCEYIYIIYRKNALLHDVMVNKLVCVTN